MSKSLLTKKQEEALRFCHHDFKCLTQEDAAKRMGISQQAISRLLNRVKKISPQYFPILTKQESKIYHYYMFEGWTVVEIAKHTSLSRKMVYESLQRARKKGMYFTEAVGRILSYDQFKDDDNIQDIDNLIKEKF